MSDDEIGKCLLKYFCIYAVVGLLSFGWNYNHWGCEEVPEKERYRCEFGREPGSAFRGMFWPVWLAGELAIKITTWP